MEYITVNKLSKLLKIDYYQLEKYIKYLGIKIAENKSINIEYIDIIKEFLDKYSTSEISYIISHNISYPFEGILLLNLRKKYNLNEKQFKLKIEHIDLEFKYVYSVEECKKFDDFINSISILNRAELRDLKYINQGWIPLKYILDEFGKKYDLCKNTGMSILKKLNIEIYKPLHQLAFINEEQKNQFENFLKQFDSAKERKLYLQEQTCMEKYGVENPSFDKNARNKISESSRKKINFALNNNLINVKELANLFEKDKHTIIDVIQSLNIKIIIFKNDNHYYISKNDIFKLDDYFSKTEMSGISYSEKEIVDFIKSIYNENIIENSKKLISPKELDIYIPSKNLAIEYDGLYWHDENHINKNYHLIKTKMCNAKGIDLIHVFEDDWLYKKEIVKSMISSRLGIYKEKIFARKCKCQILDYTLYKSLLQNFFNENHLQGFTYCNIFIGLFYENELIQCMGFNKKGFHDGNVELTRMATKLNTQVIGGFSKLMKFVVNIYEFKKITSYVYKAWFNGNGYLKSGFVIIKQNPPSYSYILNGKRIHKSHFRKNKLKKMYEYGELNYFNEKESEHKNMLENKIYRIYDCGTIKVVYQK